MTDEELIEFCKQGEEWAFEELIKKYHGSIYNYIFNATDDKQLAQDLAQETFIKMVRNIEKYRSIFETKFSTWLFKIARNTLNDQYRKTKNKTTVSLDIEGQDFSSHYNLEAEVVFNDRLKGVNQAIDDLPKEERSMVYLRYYMNLSYKEIGEILSCSQQRVKWQLHSALLKIRKIVLNEVNYDET